MFQSLKDIADKILSAKLKRKKKIGLALGSGSARGWSHIGVIRALSDAGIKPDCIAGTSMGALVGSFYAAGSIDELEEFARNFDWKQLSSFIDISLPRTGLIEGRKLSDFFHKHLKDMNIEDTDIPLATVATDLNTGTEVIIRKGSLIDAVRASISVPGVFTPVQLNNMLLVDGGLVNPVPVSVLKEMGADIVIAVDLNHDLLTSSEISIKDKDELIKKSESENRIIKELNTYVKANPTSAFASIQEWFAPKQIPNIFEIMYRSIDIASVKITKTNYQSYPADILIQPNLGHIGFFEFHKASEAIKEGYWHTNEKVHSCKISKQ